MAGGHGIVVDRNKIRFGLRRQEHVAVVPREVRGELRQPFDSPLRGPELDHQIAPLGKPEFAQPLLEGHIVGLGARRQGQPADPVGPLGLLSLSESGTGQCAAQLEEESSSTVHLLILSDAHDCPLAPFPVSITPSG